MEWSWKKFDELDARELFEIYEMRQRVFVIEQDCAYPDIDALDLDAWHLSGREGDRLLAYLRVISSPDIAPFVAIGRIVTDQSVRGKGVGSQLFKQGMDFIQTHFAQSPMKISAQVHLENFYSGFGFKTVSEPYDEDGIMHIDMHYHEL